MHAINAALQKENSLLEQEIERVSKERDEWTSQTSLGWNSKLGAIEAEKSALACLERRVGWAEEELKTVELQKRQAREEKQSFHTQLLLESKAARDKFATSQTSFLARQRSSQEADLSKREDLEKVTIEHELVEEETFRIESELEATLQDVAKAETICKALMEKLSQISRARQKYIPPRDTSRMEETTSFQPRVVNKVVPSVLSPSSVGFDLVSAFERQKAKTNIGADEKYF